jgi:hypothetical protein
MPALFDMELRALRRDRAARSVPELFLYDRAFNDCLERISLVQRRFEQALLIGCPNAAWPDRLRELAGQVDVRDPGRRFAEAADGDAIVEDSWTPQARIYDLVIAIGTLDTVNDLQRALMALHFSMQPESLLIGAMSGGETLPKLRSAMRAADVATGAASPHVHPRIEASALAPLLTAAGFINAVVDIDRVQVAYRSFDRLVGDLRRMAATNLLVSRARTPLSKHAAAEAARCFSEAAIDDRTVEVFEILHFACWTPPVAASAE